MAFSNEVRQHFLIKAGRAKIDRTPDGQKTVDQIRRNNDIAQPQGRKQDFAEGPDIYNAGIGIETLQGRDGRALVSVLAIVIVLYNLGWRLASAFQ